MKSILILVFSLLTLSSTEKRDDWELSKEKNGVKVYTRTRPGEKLKEFKALATFNCTKQDVEAVLMDVKNMHLWYDMVEKVEVLKQLSPTEAVYKIYFDFPSLAQDRYSTIKASISKDANTGNIKAESSFYKISHKAEVDRTFVNKIQSTWQISGKDGAIGVEHSAFMDPAGSIPQWIINATLTDGPIKTLSNLRKRACK